MNFNFLGFGGEGEYNGIGGNSGGVNSSNSLGGLGDMNGNGGGNVGSSSGNGLGGLGLINGIGGNNGSENSFNGRFVSLNECISVFILYYLIKGVEKA